VAIEVEDFPAFIVVDDKGNDFFAEIFPSPLPVRRRCASLSMLVMMTETELLLRINRGLPVELRARYDALRSRLSAGTLDADEHADLLRLTDEIERMQADRVAALAEVARLRGQKLGDLMNDLGIHGPEDAGAAAG
jgi:mRNA-degrading endonuclease toxin of MazEF toxin-antitoxin module